MTNPDFASPQKIMDDSSDKSGIPESKSVEEKLQELLDKALYANGRRSAQKMRNLLNGTWLGEPLHVVLTDIPIGAWTVTILCDALDSNRNRGKFSLAADTSLAFGLFGAAGAAVTGIIDWSDVDPPARRLGFIHGLLNVGVTALFTASFILRKRKLLTGGRVSAALGYALLSLSAHLGGKLVYDHRVGVDRAAGEVFPQDFVSVLAESKLVDSMPIRASYEGVPILLVRRGQKIFAMANTCSHFSGPLSEGKLVGDSIVCPYHASRFALDDGHVLDGPAVHPQPCLEVRARDGQIEVRKPAAKG
ncbi:MAG: hypothetical protein DMG91_15895 [Acidobacteria bacterium]|nr:MAG: hypothetical protein DMG91_15895 [Acidobacteriota bacterium]